MCGKKGGKFRNKHQAHRLLLSFSTTVVRPPPGGWRVFDHQHRGHLALGRLALPSRFSGEGAVELGACVAILDVLPSPSALTSPSARLAGPPRAGLASTRVPSTGARASPMDSRRPAGGAPAHRARSPLPVLSLWHRARSLISPEAPRARALSSSLWLHHPVSTPVPPAHCSGLVRHHSAPPRVCR